MFDIWIVGPELELVEPEFLVVETSVCRGGWYDDPDKKTTVDGWGADLGNEGGIGTYTTSDLGKVPTDIVAQSFQIQYFWSSKQIQGRFDGQPVNFWEFYINWGWNDDNRRMLRVWTDYGAEAEGTYYPAEDKWIVNFIGANWELWGSDAYGNGYLIDSDTINSALDVTIINTGPVAS